MTKIPLKEQAADILNTNGFHITPDDIRVARGYWSHAHQDCYRWEVNEYGCWFSLAEFVKYAKKYGFTINEREKEIEPNNI